MLLDQVKNFVLQLRSVHIRDVLCAEEKPLRGRGASWGVSRSLEQGWGPQVIGGPPHLVR